MRKILLASHRNMAEGMRDTLEFLTGMHNLYAISAYMDEISLQQQIEEFTDMLKPEDTLLILTDMQGGSVNQMFCPLMSKRVHLICGINLPLALSLALIPQEQQIDAALIEALLEESRQQIRYMNTFTLTDDSEDEV